MSKLHPNGIINVPTMPGLSARALDLLKVPAKRQAISIESGSKGRVPVIPKAQRSQKNDAID